MPTSAILVTSYDPAYLAIYDHLVRIEAAAEHAPVVLDVSGLLATPIDTYHRGVLRAFRLTYPGNDLAQRLTASGAEYCQASDLGASTDTSALDERLEDALATAVLSATITFFRTDRPDRRRRAVARTMRNLTNEGRAVYHAVRELCAQRPDMVRAYLPNGRFPHQKMAMMAFQDAGVATRHIEKGHAPERAYVQDYSPHDRFRSQGSVDTVLAGLSDSEVETIADEWLARRAPAKDSSNEYSALWTAGLPQPIAAWKAAGDRVAGFFTSSQDEFLFQGDEWQVHEWEDQFAAFDRMLSRFEADGYRCYLRVHPNLATRAHDYFLRERASIRQLARRHPGLAVIWHDDRANSYTLLDASDAVVVFASTIGVEASARGLPVWATAATTYGEVADTRQVFSPEELDRDDLAAWNVDPRGAKRYIAYLVKRDQEITEAGLPWTTWNERRPLGARLAAIAVSGGTPGVGTAIWSLIDQYRHRGLRANWRVLRRW